MQSSRTWMFAAGAVLASLAVAGVAAGPSLLGGGAPGGDARSGVEAATAPEVTVYKSPTCGCCRQ